MKRLGLRIAAETLSLPPANRLWEISVLQAVKRGGLFYAIIATFFCASCSLTATRPIQEMSDSAVALRAAREVGADTLAPELFREASEWYQLAKQQYRFKNFRQARNYSNRARELAEEAEFTAVRSGGKREGVPPDPLSAFGGGAQAAEPGPVKNTDDEFESPNKPLSIEGYEEKKKQEGLQTPSPPGGALLQ